MTPQPAAACRPAPPLAGSHVFVSGGLATAGLRYARDIGAEAIQVFVSNPRSWALSAGDAAQDRALRDHAGQAGLPVFVHAAYLVNVGSPDPVTRERSVASLRHALRRGRDIGARGVVVHAGSAAGGSREAGLRHARECLLPVLEAIPDDGPDLLLEPMAGQGQMLCATAADVPRYFEALGWHPRAALCLDTCHAFAAGHDLVAPGGAGATVDALTAALEGGGTPGAARLRLVHANDSKDPCGSCRDRHENIGAGQIGEPPFAALLAHPALAGVPFIVETPGSKEAHAADVATLKRLRPAHRPLARA